MRAHNRPQIAVTASVVVLGVSLAAALGRQLDAPRLASYIGDAVTIKPVTIAGFIVAAVSLLLTQVDRRYARRASAAGAATVMLLAVLAIGEYVAQRDFVTNLVWAERPGAAETVYPGRMAPNTAAGFLAYGLALMFFRARRRLGRWVTNSGLIVMSAIALQVLIGYLYGADSLRGVGEFTPMALPTAINFALLAIGLTAARHDHWLMTLLLSDGAGAKTARVLLPLALSVPVLTGWLRLRGEQLGWYGTADGVALFALTNILILGAVILWSAQRLQRDDVARRRRHDGLRRALYAQDAIAEMDLQLGGVKRAIVSKGQELANADAAILVRLHGNELRYVAASATAEAILDAGPVTLVSFAGEAIRQNEVLQCSNASNDDRVEPALRTVAGTAAMIALPLQSRRTTGALVLLRNGVPFTPEEIELVQLMRPSAAGALAHAAEFEAGESVIREQSAELTTLGQRFSAFMENLPAATFIKDSAGRYLYANSSFEKLFGTQLVDILGASDEEIFHGDVTRTLTNMHLRVLSEGETISADVAIARGGSERHLFTLMFPIRDAIGRSLAGGIALDVTEQKSAEARIVELNETLEARVIERTDELARANKELEAFSYSVSHDLRAPLRAVDGYTRLLQEDYAPLIDEEGRRFLDVIRSESTRMGQLIDDLLAFSRISRQSLSPSLVDLSALTEEVMREIRRDRPERPIRLSYDSVPAAHADRSTIRQVLINLLSNAAKYAKPSGMIEIELGGRKNGAKNVYWVKDNGVGFDMRYVDKLFQVFQRLHTSEEFEGTGVGLAIVSRIVARHGGECWAEGTPGEGACFYFSLPAAPSEVRPAAAEEEVMSQREARIA